MTLLPKNTEVDIQSILIHQTDHWLAVNKPAGISVERQPGVSDTLEDLLYNYLSQRVKKPFVGIVHRLDRPTSGVLLVALKKSALSLLNEQFRMSAPSKIYHALTNAPAPAPQGVLRHFLKKDLISKKAIAFTQVVPESKEATLSYKILELASSRYHLWEIQLLSGKFHQIRAQLAEIGCPVVGDVLYGGIAIPRPHTIGLHAASLSFIDPISKQQVLLKAPYPDHIPWSDLQRG